MSKSFKILAFHLLFSCALLILRVFHSGSITYIFLIWNLLLAYIPYFFSLYLDHKKHWAINLSFLASWLLFFPNAPYIITDFIHLHLRPSHDFWFDLIIFFSFALNGLCIGFLSLHKVFKWVSKQWSPISAWFLAHLALTASAFGIYLGRIERWNSWDAVIQPFSLLKNIYHLLFPIHEQAETWWFTILFGVFLTAHYYFFIHFSNKKEFSQNEISQ